jgi:hypothetical protein
MWRPRGDETCRAEEKAGAGRKYFYVEYADGVGNNSSWYSDRVEHQQ